jgi:hypothetical protein
MANMENKGSRFDTGALGSTVGRQEQERQESVVEKAKDTGSQAIEKAKDMGSQAMEKAKDYASSVSEQVSQTASRLGERAEHTYEAGRDYVTHRGLRGMGEDVTDIIRRNPVPAVLVGLGIGFLIARAMRED